jgi:hypothetical protein
MRTLAAQFVVVVSAVLSGAVPAAAAGKHIVCNFKASITDKSGQVPVTRSLKFFLDDTHSQLTSEGGELPEGMMLDVRTTSYSDAEIHADINVGPLSGGPFFFGRVTDGEVAFVINRVSGIAVYATKYLPDGAEVGMGPCHEVAPPSAKF